MKKPIVIVVLLVLAIIGLVGVAAWLEDRS
jgi:hypothetical protein